MDYILQHIYDKLSLTHSHKPTKPSTSFHTFLQSHRHPQSPTLPLPTSPNYNTILQQIQQQLQKRIINVQKIKDIGQQLYTRLSDDITTLHENDMVLAAGAKMEAEVGDCDRRYDGLVGELIGKYRQYGGQNFDGWIAGVFLPYCVAVDKEIIAVYAQLLKQISIVTIPSLSQQQSPNPQPLAYSQSLPTLLELLTKFRTLLTSEYQLLHTSTPSKQEQCRSAVLFLSKLRTMILDMKDILCGDHCMLERVYRYAGNWVEGIRDKVRNSYWRNIYMDGEMGEGFKQWIDGQLAQQSKLENQQQQLKLPAGETIPKPKPAKNSKNIYNPQVKRPPGFHHICHTQILKYLHLCTLQPHLLSISQKLTTQYLHPCTDWPNQSPPNHPLIRQAEVELDLCEDVVGLCGTEGFREVIEVTERVAARLHAARGIMGQMESFVAGVGRPCGDFIRRIGQISKMDRKLEDNKYVEICMELYHIANKLEQAQDYLQAHPLICTPQCLSILSTKISECSHLRHQLHKSHVLSLKKHKNKPTIPIPNSVNQNNSNINSRVMQSQQINPHMLIEEEPEEEPVEDGSGDGSAMEAVMEYLDATTEFYQYQFKDIVGNGFDFAICYLQRYSSKANDARLRKLSTIVSSLLQKSQKNTHILSTHKISPQFRKQCQIATVNTSILHQLLTTLLPTPTTTTTNITTTTTTITTTNTTIIQQCDQCLNFEYQDCSKKVKQFEEYLGAFVGKCKIVSGLHQNNTTSLYSIVYRVLKEFTAVLEICCDILEEIFYIFSSSKKLQQDRKGNIVNKPIDIGSETDLNYLTALIAYKVKMVDQISQLEKFGNIPKNCRNYLKAIYGKFRNGFNYYLPYQGQALQGLADYMQFYLSFLQNGKQIFLDYQNSLSKIGRNRAELDQLWSMSKEIQQLEARSKQIEKIGDLGVPVHAGSVDAAKKYYRIFGDSWRLARLVGDLFDSRGKVSGEYKNFDAKKQGMYTNLAEVYRSCYY